MVCDPSRTATVSLKKPLRLVGAALALTVMAACDVNLLDGADKAAVRAQFRETGSACEVEILFTNSVVGLPESKPDYYRLPSGERAVRATNVAGVHAVLVAFPNPVTTSDSIVLAPDTAAETTLTIQRNTADASPALLLSAAIDANATDSVVTLTFDDALDPITATDITRYSLAGTTDHPTAATLVGCGQQVQLQLDALATTTAFDIQGLTDVNGMTVADALGLGITVGEEEDPPQVESAAFPAGAATAAVDLTFNEVVDLATVANLAQYTLTPAGTNPISAEVLPGGRVVRLGFASIDPPVSISAEGIRDLAGNMMAASSSISVAEAQDDTPPAPVSATPAGFGMEVTIRVTLSEAVTQVTGQRTSSYTLRDGSDTESLQPTLVALIDGAAAVDLTFDYIPEDARVEVSGLADLNGNTMPESVVVLVDFENDDTAPQVWRITFVPDALEPSVDVAFDKTLDSTSAQDTTNYLFSTGANPISATLQTDGRTARLATTQLARTTTLSVDGVRDTASHVMEALTDQPINTAGDTTSPTVVSATFATNKQTPTVYVTYSEVIDLAGAESTGSFISTADSQHPASAQLNDDGRTVTLTFGPMPLVTQIRTGTITDLSGNTLETTTVDIDPSAEQDAPTIVSATYLPNTLAPTVDIVFSEAVDKTLAEAPGLYNIGSDPKVALTAVMQDDGHTVRATFPGASVGNELAVRSVTDMSGNAVASAGSVTIASADDGNRPVAVSAVFAANAASPTVSITFSEAVDLATAQTISNFQITSGGGGATSATLQSDGHTVLAVFPPMDATDQVSIQNIKDLADNTMDGSAQIVVARNGETTAPSVISAVVDATTQMTVTFSEAVDEASAEDVANYNPAGSTSATSAILQSDGRTVIVQTTGAPLSSGNAISISGVKDLSSNTMALAAAVTLG